MQGADAKTAVCPKCGSGKVREGIMEAVCSECGWEGEPSGLIRAPLSTVPGQDVVLDVSQPDQALALLQQVSTNLMNLIGKLAGQPIGKAIFAVGLVGKKDTKNLARLIRAGCLAAHKAILDECEEIAKESKAERKKNAS